MKFEYNHLIDSWNQDGNFKYNNAIYNQFINPISAKRILKKLIDEFIFKFKINDIIYYGKEKQEYIIKSIDYKNNICEIKENKTKGKLLSNIKITDLKK